MRLHQLRNREPRGLFVLPTGNLLRVFVHEIRTAPGSFTAAGLRLGVPEHSRRIHDGRVQEEQFGMTLEEILSTRNKILTSASVEDEPVIVASFEVATQLCRIADALDLLAERALIAAQIIRQ